MRKPLHQRAKEHAGRSKNYSTARGHLVNAGSYFVLFLVGVVAEHVAEEWRSRSQPDEQKQPDEQRENDRSWFDRLLAGM